MIIDHRKIYNVHFCVCVVFSCTYIVSECRQFTLPTLHQIVKVERGNCVAWLLTSYTMKTRIYIMGEVNSSTIIIYYGAMLDGYTELDAGAREMAQAPSATVVGACCLHFIYRLQSTIPTVYTSREWRQLQLIV